MRRVAVAWVIFASFFFLQLSWASQPDFHLQVVPATVYKVDDPGNARTSSFVFEIAVLCSSDCALTPISASVELSSGTTSVVRQEWTAEQLAKIRGTNFLVTADTPVASPHRVVALPEAFDLHFYFRQPLALAIDSASLRLTVADAKGRRAQQSMKIPVQYYEQKTKLIVPFRGVGVIGQDWITNGGHSGGFGTDFAVDLRGLDANYAEQKNNGDDNASAIGWGREIIAPAAGIVTYARNDVPNNPHQGPPPELPWFASLHDPALAYAFGDCVIIDHGNSEFSLLAHMQEGSVMVKVGDRVVAGQVIGKLGSSGSSFGPHMHYQLQTDPRILHGQSLPFKFQNIGASQLARGTQFEAK